jgi:anthranilate synthase component 1
MPVDVLRRLKRFTHKLFVLEHTGNDADGNVVWDRYSYIGFAPSLEISCVGPTVTIATAQTSFSFDSDSPIDFLRSVIAQNTAPKIPGLPPFFGGFAGYFSYEYIHLSEPTCRFRAENTEGYRDFDLMLFDKLYVLDREEQTLYLICNLATDRLETNYREAASTLDCMERMLRRSRIPVKTRGSRCVFWASFPPFIQKRRICKWWGKRSA